jgi:hypothetical protein
MDEPACSRVVRTSKPVQDNLYHAEQIELAGMVQRVPVDPIECREDSISNRWIGRGRTTIAMGRIGSRNPGQGQKRVKRGGGA